MAEDWKCNICGEYPTHIARDGSHSCACFDEDGNRVSPTAEAQLAAALNAAETQAARIAQLERVVAGITEWADKFYDDTKALPCQHESKEKGQCTYNWHMPIARELRELIQRLAAAPEGEAK